MNNEKPLTEKPSLSLTGRDGNAAALLTAAARAARKAGWNDERWEAVKKEAKAGNYDHLLGVLMEHFDVD